MSLISDHNLGKVWKHEGGSAQSMLRREQLAWLTPAQRCLAEQIRQARMLFEGNDRGYYVDEGRSAYTFAPIKAGEPAFYRPLNLLTLISLKMADLLFGESCRISIENDGLQSIVDGVVKRSWLNATLSAAATECSWAGRTYLEITRVNGDALIGHVAADEIFPLGAAGPDRQHGSYVRYATAEVGGENGTATTTLLLETYYTAGAITRRCWKIEPTGGTVARTEPVNLDRWLVKNDDQPLPESEATGLSRPSIVFIPNGYQAASDYDGLISAQDDVSAKHTQLARVLAKHADPRLYMPETAVDPATGNVSAAAEVFFGRDKASDKPEYITWNAELASAIEDRKFALLVFATKAEMPLSLLGIKDDSTAETASKMRLNAATAIAKASRVASYWQGALALAMSLAIEAETGRLPAEAIGVEMRDGLPVDEKERGETIATLRTAGVMSRRRALEAQYLEPTDVDAELKELDEETKQSMPSTLMGEPTADAAGPSVAGEATDLVDAA